MQPTTLLPRLYIWLGFSVIEALSDPVNALQIATTNSMTHLSHYPLCPIPFHYYPLNPFPPTYLIRMGLHFATPWSLA